MQSFHQPFSLRSAVAVADQIVYISLKWDVRKLRRILQSNV